jgi:hypothetical protein
MSDKRILPNIKGHPGEFTDYVAGKLHDVPWVPRNIYVPREGASVVELDELRFAAYSLTYLIFRFG